MKVMEKRDRVHVPEVLPAVKKAKFIKALQGFTGDARLYELDEPIEYRDGTTKFVAVSQTHAMFSGPETYIFASDADGEVISWGELEGSGRGRISHEFALNSAGYEVQP